MEIFQLTTRRVQCLPLIEMNFYWESRTCLHRTNHVCICILVWTLDFEGTMRVLQLRKPVSTVSIPGAIKNSSRDGAPPVTRNGTEESGVTLVGHSDYPRCVTKAHYPRCVHKYIHNILGLIRGWQASFQ